MCMLRPGLLAILGGGLVGLTSTAHAQWIEQTFSLAPGYNTVYLELDPGDPDPDHVFAALADTADRVWTWVGPRELDCPTPGTPDCEPETETGWRQWVPPGNPASIANSLQQVVGGRAYVIFAAGGTQLAIRGRPHGLAQRWRRGDNVAGFHVTSTPPTFDDYLGASAAHAGTAIHQMNSTGALTPVDRGAPIQPGRGYWVRSRGDTEYDGPITIGRLALSGLAYGETGTEQLVSVENLSATSRTVRFQVVPSLPPPAAPPGLPAHAGPVPLRFRQYQSGPNTAYTMRELDGLQLTLGPADSAQDRAAITCISVHRQGLATTSGNALYQSVLSITDGSYRRWIGASAAVPGLAGLYLGAVQVNAVAWVQADARIIDPPPPGDPYWQNNPEPRLNPDGDFETPRPTPTTFDFPVLIHYDGASTYKLISQLTMLYRPATATEPGRFVLATRSCDGCDALRAGSILDGQPFAPRFASANFSFTHDLVNENTGGGFGGQLDFQVVVDKADPLNPFRHRFHPDHDGDRNGEVFTITRRITFDFTCPPPANVPESPGSGDVRLVGCYRETIGGAYECQTWNGPGAPPNPCPDDPQGNWQYVPGLHKRDINVAGTFELRRISNVATINDP